MSTTVSIHIVDLVGAPEVWIKTQVAGAAECLARETYDDRAFHRLPILADALEDAGCDDEAILGHLRSHGPHVRGCWAVDLCLGLS